MCKPLIHSGFCPLHLKWTLWMQLPPRTVCSHRVLLAEVKECSRCLHPSSPIGDCVLGQGKGSHNCCHCWKH
jgi:hypothetical protein